MIDSSLSPCNHAYSYVPFLLTFIDIASLAALSLCAAFVVLISIFPFISLLALKGFLPIYNGLLLFMYFIALIYINLCDDQSSARFEALCFWKPFHLN